MTLSHHQRQLRRKKIAEDATQGLTVAELVERYAVSQATVRGACAEHAVRPTSSRPPGGGISPRTLTILAELINSGDTYREIGRRHRVSGSWVGSVLSAAREAGIEFPHRQDRRHAS